VTAEHVYCRLGGTGAKTQTFDISIAKMYCGRRGANVAVTRETIMGMVLGYRGGYNMATAFNTEIFGQQAVIAGYASTDPLAPVDSLQALYGGAPLHNDETLALVDTLRFLSGSRGNSWFTETFDHHHQRLGWHYRNHGVPSAQYTYHPIDLHSITGEVANAAKSFPIMVRKMLELQQRDLPGVEATIHHYNDAAAQHHPTSQIRDLSVALNALKVVVSGKQPERPGITEDTIRFIRDLGVEVSDDEARDIERVVGSILCTGHYGDESQRRDFEENQRVAALLFNIFNRTMLGLLHFSGRYLDSYSLTESYNLDSVPVRQRLSTTERISQIVQSLGLPDLVSSVEVNIGEDSSEEPSAAITLRLKRKPATDDIEMLNRFSKSVQSEVLLQDDLPWPYIKLEAPKA
jgi:hypothetical protein